MKVIVAGFSKTGTKTMQAALKELGYNVYDYMENFEFLENEWKQICTVGGSTKLFRKMYENVDAVTDLPGCIFWDEILKAFPEAKVVLTMRENEDVWYESFKRQMTENVAWKHKIRIMFSYTAYRFYLYSSRLCQFSFGTEFGKVNETLSKMYYRRHNANVMQNAPKDQLLVFNIKDGWDPLCKFLDQPVPGSPFPHKNKKASLTADVMNTDSIMLKMQRETTLFYCTTLMLGTVAAAMWYHYK
ncbi:uncharacterized protein LOC104266153 [Ciona intestinalis]